MTLSFQITPRWLFLVCTGLLLCSLVSCAPPAPPCRNDGDCSGAARYCISGACRECKEAEDCASQKCLSNGACASVDPAVSEPLPDVSREPTLESVSPGDADAAESPSEPVAEVGPEPQPEPVPEPMCANGTTRSCYPAGKNGCSVDSGGKFVCKGICAVGTESCVNGVWSGQCTGATKPSAELCNGKDDDCDGVIDNGFANLGQYCDVGQGECNANGKYVCKSDGSGTECDAKPGTPGTEVCDGKDNDCNGKIDDIADLSQTCTDTNRKGACQAGVWKCLNNQKVCKQTMQASIEICDGKDNNCDGKVDETFPTQGQLCFIITGGAQGPCSYGRLDSCGPSPNYKPVCKAIYQAAPAEICNNGIDDDCDGIIDNFPPCDCRQSTSTSDPKVQDCSKMPKSLWNSGICKPGTQTCNFNGVWSGCLNETPPSIETCDGQDNDCNGKIDEADPQLNTTCQIEQNQGVCREGTNQCQNGTLVCVAKITQPTKLDLCNGQDDDCNGKIDDSDPDSGKACAVGGKQGECAKGTVFCANGSLSCQSTTTPKTEQCNGLDDDCNGLIDDISDRSQTCTDTSRKGVCQAGVWECVNNQKVCKQTTQATTEICNGKDDDCDGQIDNGC